MNIYRLEFAKFLELAKATKTMTVKPDLCLVGSIIEKFKPLTVLEYGPYLGGWCLFVNNVLGNGVSIQGIENFYTHRWANKASVDKGQKPSFPVTSLELENYIRNISANLFNQNINIKIIDKVGSDFQTEEKFDLIRIDCSGYGIDEHYKILTNSIEMLSDNGLLIIEDVTPMHFAKLHSFSQAYFQKQIFPVVYGTQNVICTTSQEKQQQWFDNLKDLQSLLGMSAAIVDGQKVWYLGAVITIHSMITDHNNNFVTYHEDESYRLGKN